MKRTSPQLSTAAGATRPGYRRRTDLDDGDETYGQIDTPEGVGRLRVTRRSVPCYVGGRGLVPTVVYAVALRTPRTIRERQGDAGGYVEVTDCLLTPSGHAPGDHLEAHLLAGQMLARAVRSRFGDGTSPAPPTPPASAGQGDRAPARPQREARPAMPGGGDTAPAPTRRPITRPAPGRVRLVRRTYANPGAALHALLGALDVGCHYRFASDVLGRDVGSLGGLTSAEIDTVRRAAEAHTGDGALPKRAA